jgi:alpha-amylase
MKTKLASSGVSSVCFYFQVHQPYRLSDLRITNLDTLTMNEFFDEDKNRAIFRKVAEKCYLPANATLLALLKDNKDMRIAFSLSGVFLDQCDEYGPDVLASFQALAKTKQVEFLTETYYHSLSSIFSLEEFCEQVTMHTKKIKKLFGMTPTTFRNTELVYSNEIAEVVRQLGFRAILAEGADRILEGRTPNVVYTPPTFMLPQEWKRTIRKHALKKTSAKHIKTLLKNYKLSDDIAFRFGDAHRSSTPLTADVFADWITRSGGRTVNLFMDYETFGEHQWSDTGIFEFMKALPDAFNRKGILMMSPRETAKREGAQELPIIDMHAPVSWADSERDLSAWRGNHLQEVALAGVYALEKSIKKVRQPKLLDLWRRLQTSDHFYYLCTKYWADGDVHKYFSPYESPYEAYRRFSHALEGLRLLLQKTEPKKRCETKMKTTKRHHS